MGSASEFLWTINISITTELSPAELSYIFFINRNGIKNESPLRTQIFSDCSTVPALTKAVTIVQAV